MYENFTYENLLNEKLKLINDSMDKRQGSIIYDTLAPNSAESAQMYMNMEMLMNRTFADTATGEDLDRRVWERNIKRHDATNAVVKAVFTGENGEFINNINTGERFSGGGNDYAVTEKISDGCYKMVCEKAGNAGNLYKGTILPIEYVEGLLKAEITDIIIYGEEAESDESLRKRYFNSFETKAFGGNIEDYKRLFKEIDGVGGCKVFPAYYGGGTVRVVILNNGYNVPEGTLIEDIQEYVDPQPKGSGIGAVPIGHNVTVEAANSVAINIKFTLTLESGFETEFIVEQVKEKIEEYFCELREGWENEGSITVRKSRIEMKVLEIDGVIDIEDITLNDNTDNIVIESDEIPILGTVENV